MFEMSEEIAPFSPIHGVERFDMQCAAWQEFLQTQQADGPCELVVRVAPFDQCPRSWELRQFSDHERALMDEPMIRLQVQCLNLYCDTVIDSEFAIAYPPAEEGFDWSNGVHAVTQMLADLVCDLQATYLGRVYREMGWDVEKFLEETEDILTDNEQTRMVESQFYRHQLALLLEDELITSQPEAVQVAYRALYDALCAYVDDLLGKVQAAVAAVKDAESVLEDVDYAAIMAEFDKNDDKEGN